MVDLLSKYAGLQPKKLAVIDDRPDGTVTRWTFAELERRANRLAHALIGLGVTKGTKLLWCGQNSPDVVALVNASRKIGSTAVPLNYRSSDEEAAYITNHSDATVVYSDAEMAPVFDRIRGQLPNVAHYVVYDGPAPPGMESAAELTSKMPDRPATGADSSPGDTMIYTSGTTGKPKGALRRGGGDPVQVMAMVALIGYRTDDVYLTTGPLYHSGPAGFMGIAQLLGQTVVLQRRFDPTDWLRLVDTYRVTSTFSAPTPIRMVCNLPAEVKARFDRSSMRCMIANAAPWSLALKQLYIADFPADSLFEVYGSTELGVNCILEPRDQLRKPGSCGRPAPGVDVKLFSDDGKEVKGRGPEHPGELYVRSASIFADYYKQHDIYVQESRNGYQTVGDIAYRDAEGYYYICDRKKDMIISGGMNIYPAEVEGVLDQHPDIYEAAVFGIPNEEWGESVHAVVVARPGADLAAHDVISYSREHLAAYKAPKSVSFAEELPKTGSGKLLKRELRGPYWVGYSRQVG